MKKSKNPNWNGGITKFIYRIRMLAQYKRWKWEILQRDYPGITEKEVKKKRLQVHHLDGVKELIDKYSLKTTEDAIKCERLWDISNGVTLKKGEHFIITSLGRIKYPTRGFLIWLNNYSKLFGGEKHE